MWLLPSALPHDTASNKSGADNMALMGGCGQVVAVFSGKWITGLVVNGARRNSLLSSRISEHTKRAF